MGRQRVRPVGARSRKVLLPRLGAAAGREERSGLQGIAVSLWTLERPMIRSTTKRIALTFVILLVAAVAFAGDAPQPKGKLSKVEPKTVCMVNEQAMGKDQIPVEVDGKTYYGCCEMCKKTLATSAEKRVA